MTAPAARADVVVIGGGVVGVFAALHLARAGRRVMLCEKGRVAGEQSSRNWGWIRKQGRDPVELPLMAVADALWAETVPLLDVDVGWGRRGVAYAVETEAQEAARLAWLEAARPFGLDSRMLTSAQAAALIGRDDRPLRAALHTPSDAAAEPALAAPAVARLARAAGARVLERCAVRALDLAAGRVAGVLTERGRVACDAAILAGGAWSRPLLENHGVALAQLGVVASAQRTTPAPGVTACAFGADAASIRRRADGGCTVARTASSRFELTPAALRHLWAFRRAAAANVRALKPRLGVGFAGPLGWRRWRPDQVSPFERWRVLEPLPDAGLLADTMRAAQALHPALRGARRAAAWAGVIDVTPDELPVIDAVPALPGLTVATGCSGHGFGLGPGVGRLAAEIAMGDAPVVDPAPFRLSRLHNPRHIAQQTPQI